MCGLGAKLVGGPVSEANVVANAAGRHVLIVVQNLSVPLDRRVWQEAQALRDAGYRVSVVCPRGPGEPPERVLDGIEIHTYAPAREANGVLGFVWEFAYSWLRTAWLVRRANARKRLDVVQACNPPDTYWLLGAIARRLWGSRFVYDQHDLCPEVYEARFGRAGALHRALVWLERRTYRTADTVISTNDSYRAVAQQRGGIPDERSAVVRSCPDPATMRRGDPHPELRHGREHLVCYLGIMGPQDGVDRLLGAVDVYVNELGRTDCQFGLMGFGDCLDELRADATRRGLDDYVTFTGRVGLDEIGRWLSTADIGVTPDPPTRFNDLSTMNKTLEYMAHELPVVGFELTENTRSAGPAGLNVPDDDRALAKAIAGLLDDPDRRATMGKAGRQRIESELSWERQVPVYVGVFDRLTSAGATGRTQPTG